MRELKSIKHINIIGAGAYGWQCFGKNQGIYDIFVSSKYMDESSSQNEIGSFVMNNKGEVAEITFYKLKKDDTFKAWRWMDSKFLDSYMSECAQRGINPKSFLDDVEYKDVSKEKILSLIESYSTKVHNKLKNSKKNSEEATEDVEIVLDDADFSFLAKKAHEQNITFNQLVNNILREDLERKEKENLLKINSVSEESDKHVPSRERKTKKFL